MKALSLLLMLLILSGCAHQGISREAVKLVDRSVTYDQLREDPDRFIGRYVYLGGSIAKVANRAGGGELEVVELGLDSSGKPRNDIHSGGRFFARSDRFLDPLIFRPGLFVSLVGEVKGHKDATLDTVNYRYPVIAIREMHVWRPEDYQQASPTFHFGLGVFQGF